MFLEEMSDLEKQRLKIHYERSKLILLKEDYASLQLTQLGDKEQQ